MCCSENKQLAELRLQGGTFVYVLLLSLLLSGLLSGLLLVQQNYQQFFNRLYFSDLAGENLRSGLAYLFSERNFLDSNHAYQLFETDLDSAYYRTESWGLWGLLHGEGVYAGKRVFQSAFFGQEPVKNWKAALYLKEERQPLSMAGFSTIEGQLYLPMAGMRMAYVNGQGYEGPAFDEYLKLPSKAYMPGLRRESLQEIFAQLQQLSIPVASPGKTFSLEEPIQQRVWHEPAVAINVPGSLNLGKASIVGKCKIVAKDELLIPANAELEGTLLFARNIRIQAGFVGQIQAFASESIVVEQGVKLNYPSVLLVGKTGNVPMQMEIQSGSEIEGFIALIGESPFLNQADREDYLFLAEGSTVWGTVYASRNLDLRSLIRGHVLTANFRFHSPRGRLLNHLVNADIQPRLLSKGYLNPLVQREGSLALLKWIPNTASHD